MPIAKNYHQTRLALGSDTTLVVATSLSQNKVDKIFNKLWLQIFEFEKKFSRFLPYSELSIFNKNAGFDTVVSPEFHDLFTASINMANYTSHLFNPFILPALQKAGYTNSAVDTYKNDNTDNYAHRSVTTVNQAKITPKSITIPANTAIDFGGIGKGYLADLLAKHPDLKFVDGFWFSIGGDIIGSGVDESGNYWKVAIQDAQNPLSTLKDDVLPSSQHFSIASSGTIVKKFAAQKKQSTAHHIINPITLKPATTDILLATVVAPSTCEADVLASCAVILGSKKAKSFLRQKGINNAILQKTNSEVELLSNELQGALL